MSGHDRPPLPMTFAVIEIREDNNVFGYAIKDKATNETRYQISAPWADELEYSIIHVVRHEPFEFVEMGYHPTKEIAFATVQRHIVQSEVAKARRNRRK